MVNTRHLSQEVELVVAQEYEARKRLDETRTELGMKHLAMSNLENQLGGHRKELAKQRLETSGLQKQLDETRQVRQLLVQRSPLKDELVADTVMHRKERDEFREVALLRENESVLHLEATLMSKVAENEVLTGRVSQLQDRLSKLGNQTKTREEYVKRFQGTQKACTYRQLRPCAI